MPSFDYEATLDNDQYLKALREINNNMKRLANQGERQFNRVQAGSKKSAIQIGVVSGVVASLTQSFINLGVRGVAAFAEISKEGIQLNRQAEQLQISLTAVFQGNEKAAERFIELTRQTALGIGANVAEFQNLAKSILPDVGDAEKTLAILEQATLLGQDAGQNAEGVRIALEEALASGGQAAGLQSLQRRLNLPPESIRRIQALNEELELSDAILTVLNERVERAGISAALFGDTLASRLAIAQGEVASLQKTVAAPVFEEFKDQLNSVLGAFQDNKGDIERVATAFGQVAASVVEIIGTGLTDLINNIDYEEFEGLADDFQSLLDTASLLADILLDPGLADSLIEGGRTLVQLLDRALTTAAQIAAIVRAEAARNKAERQVLGIEGTIADNAIGEAGARAAAKLAGETELLQQADEAGQDAFDESFRQSLEKFDERENVREQRAQRRAERGQPRERGTDADLAAGEAAIQEQRRLEELARLESEALSAQEKIDAARIKQAEETEQQLTDILIDQERDRLKEVERNAQQRAKIERDNQDRLADIALDFERAIEDLEAKVGADEAKRAREQGRKRIEVERKLADERTQIVLDYQREIEAITQDFNRSAEEAERDNDVQTFLAAQRRRDQALQDADQDREDSLKKATDTAAEEREKLSRQQEQATEEARIKSEERLAILNTELERSLEDQRIANERALREQDIKEQQARDARLLANQQEIDDFDRHNEIRLKKLEEQLAKELAIVKQFEEEKAKLRQETLDLGKDDDDGFNRGFGFQRPPGGAAGGLTPFQHGGRFRKGQGLLVGERGPEALFPDFSGFILNNRLLRQLPSQTGSINNQTTYDQRDQSMHLSSDVARDPVLLAQMRNVAREEIVRSRGV